MAILNPRGIPYELAANGLPHMSGDDPVHEINEWTEAFVGNIDLAALGAAAASHTHALSSMSGNLSSSRVNFSFQNVPQWWENETNANPRVRNWLHFGNAPDANAQTIKFGKLVLFFGSLVRGTTTNHGSGWYNIVLPSQPARFREVYGGGMCVAGQHVALAARTPSPDRRIKMKMVDGPRAGQDLDSRQPNGDAWQPNQWWTFWLLYREA